MRTFKIFLAILWVIMAILFTIQVIGGGTIPTATALFWLWLLAINYILDIYRY